MQVIVVGGGVAGTTTAIALRRTGADVTMYEAREDPGGEVGSFLSLASNGLRGLAAIDCLDRVRAIGFPVPRQRMWTGSGALLGDVARGRLASDPLHSITLMRSALVRELRQAASDAGVTVVIGATITGAREPADGGVRVTLSDATITSADLLVGADGIWSTTRRILDRDAPTPVYAGLYGVSGVSRDVPTSVGEPGTFNMVFARNGAFIYLRTPDDEIWWQAQISDATRPERDGVDDAEWLHRAQAVYHAETIPSLILEAASRLHRPTIEHTLAPVRTWHSRSMVLVGDSAHPVGAGQGASMAIEDGLVLSAALSQASCVEHALADFYAKREARVARMMKLGADNQSTKKSGPLKRTAERVIMPIVFKHFYERATGWLYSYDT